VTAWLVILNWNGKNDTLELLSSLQAADLSDTTVLVVDNGSSDGTLDAVTVQHPWARTLSTGENLGYAGGNNRGIQLALDCGADVVGVLNNDTLVDPGFWPPLVTEARSGRVAASPDIRLADQPEVSWFYGAVIDEQRALPRHLQPEEQPGRDQVTESALLTGCCIVASATTWKEVGLLDEKLFLIFEDSDWSMRAHRQNVNLLLEPRSVITHKVSRSFQASQSQIGLYYYCRNGLIFAWRWTGPAGTIRFLFAQILRPILSDTIHGRRSALRTGAVSLVATLDAGLGFRGKAGRLATRIATPRHNNSARAKRK
jgi:GT2 family glycosyltransferase